MISNFRPFGRSFGVSQMFLFSGIKSSAGFPNNYGSISTGDQSVEKGDLSVTFSLDGKRDVCIIYMFVLSVNVSWKAETSS